MPALFNKLGISFTYPENWTLDETETLEGSGSAAVYSPGGAFWSVSVHPPKTPPAELVRAAVTALRETYDELDEEPIEEEIVGHRLVGADVNFYCLDLTNTAVIRAFTAPSCTGLIYCQADDRELSAIEPVFQAMTLSLMQGFARRAASDFVLYHDQAEAEGGAFTADADDATAEDDEDA